MKTLSPNTNFLPLESERSEKDVDSCRKMLSYWMSTLQKFFPIPKR